MYVLHYAPDNASLIVRLALEETGLPYRCALVDRAARAQDSAAYRALNPTGLIPTLVTSDGPISETAAILLWLSETHPNAGLAPLPGSPLRQSFLKWLFFLSNTAHTDLRQIFYPTKYVAPDAIPGHAALAHARMRQHFGLLDHAAAETPALFTAPSVLGAYCAVLMRWSVLYPQNAAKWFDAAQVPALQAIAQQLESRPATHAAARAEGLGATPFSMPAPALPPEGTAL